MNSVDKKKLRAEAHTLKPMVMIGQSGLTAAVLAEIEQALGSHELIKFNIHAQRTWNCINPLEGGQAVLHRRQA